MQHDAMLYYIYVYVSVPDRKMEGVSPSILGLCLTGLPESKLARRTTIPADRTTGSTMNFHAPKEKYRSNVSMRIGVSLQQRNRLFPRRVKVAAFSPSDKFARH